jgi:hypothetical protein
LPRTAQPSARFEAEPPCLYDIVRDCSYADLASLTIFGGIMGFMVLRMMIPLHEVIDLLFQLVEPLIYMVRDLVNLIFGNVVSRNLFPGSIEKDLYALQLIPVCFQHPQG